MNNLDDLFRQDAASRSSTNPSEQPFDKEAWAQKKQELRQWTYETIDAATSSIAQSGDEFQRYLDVQSRFDRYSVSNALLILAQRPEATRIADFDTWKEQGVFIRRKETGFYILEPGEEYRREDGSTGISYNPKKMFDIAQTTASQKREQPTYPDDRMRIKALVDRAPVPIVINDALPPEMHALYQPDTRNIVIRRGLDAGDIFRSLAQELAHAELDRGDGRYSRSDFTFHAYCASYMLCKQFGVDTSSFLFHRMQEKLKDIEPQQVRAELTVMKDAAHDMARRMNRMLAQQRQQLRTEPAR
ncbi:MULTISPECIES: ArdC-like ssDNA-binding domain-containing protein [Paenibacillus]|uniref:ArdC-like ssDNA-binding domain-containing protein n=1 Tax=Paenibacillus TaxID=44249 RepID=UPI0011A129AE|nr:ArdC-like ssDNA-binding domain-containing protein [Paenibacillus sp. IHBB 10380]